jgi:hypothetical protein
MPKRAETDIEQLIRNSQWAFNAIRELLKMNKASIEIHEGLIDVYGELQKRVTRVEKALQKLSDKPKTKPKTKSKAKTVTPRTNSILQSSRQTKPKTAK